jgi:hypothetical protein
MRAGRAGTGVKRAMVGFLTLVSVAGCSSASKEPSSGGPASRVSHDSRLPAGWVRYSYGALSVGAPSDWKVVSWVAPPANNTVSETTTSTVQVSAGNPPPNPPTNEVSISCGRGQVSHMFSEPGPGTFVDWKSLHYMRSARLVYLQGDSWQGLVSVPAQTIPPSLATRLLDTVEPTGKAC